MRRILLAALLASLVLPAAAHAVTITEFDVAPGGPSEQHLPYRIHAWPDGNLHYADQGTSPSIGRISPAGERLAPESIAGGAGAAPSDLIPVGQATRFTSSSGLLLYNPQSGLTFPIDVNGPSVAVAVDATGAEVHDRVSGGTTQLCLSANQCTIIGGTGPVSELQLGPDGRLWGVQTNADRVIRVVPGTTTVDLAVPLPVSSLAEYLTAGPDGNIWVTASLADAVDRITPAGIRTRFPLPQGTGPEEIVAGPDGALWIAGSGSSTVVRMTADGAVTNVFPTPTPNAQPIGMAVGPDGAIWFTESTVDKIGRLVLDPISAAGRGGAGGGGTAGVRDTVAPRVTGTPRFDPARVRTGRSTTLRVTLSEPAKLRITIARKARGRRVDGRCMRPTARNRKRPSCTRYVTATTLNRNGIQGANAITVSARGLSRGTYRATIAVTDPAGNTARAIRVAFTVVAR